jgi:arylsulfatase A-like enzyme
LVEPGSTSDDLVVGTDLFVTLAHLGGGSVPDDRPIDGMDVRTVLSGGELGSRTVFWALDSVSNLEFAVRKGDWKLLIDREGNPRELYDLAVDPLEMFNVREDEPTVVTDLMSQFVTQRYLRGEAPRK